MAKQNEKESPAQKNPPAREESEAGSAQDLSEQYENRFKKLQELIQAGKNPYDNSYARTHTTADLLAIPAEKHGGEAFRLAGRIRSRRIMGKAGFMDLEDEAGRMQVYASNKEEGLDYELFKELDLGDIIGIEGTLFTTKTGQTTIHMTYLVLLAKCIRPLPVVKEADGKVFDAFADKELRYRMRYVDLIVNPDVKKTFLLRSRIIQEIRSYLTEKGFLEVETPMMHPIPGGASARPFTTHHNALGMDLYLRIAPELYLKRLIVGGFAKVFELNRNFRNEGISYKHNPEFTMLELYEAFSDMNGMMALCEEMLVRITKSVHGKLAIPYGEHTIDMSAPWRRVTYLDSLKEFGGVELKEGMDLEQAKKAAMAGGIRKEDLEGCTSFWRVAEVVFDNLVEARLIQPVFITHFPTELSPLAKVWPEDRNFVERFEPYIAGREMGNAFSELNDPIDQKNRFEEQVRERESGEGEGGYMDHDYIRALEYGLPPTGGMGIGIDRLVMLLTNSHSIRDTILFPLMRPTKSED